MIGRDFTTDDEKAGSAPVAMVSHFLWQSRYGSKPDVLGRAIRVNLQTYTVVGVMPEGEGISSRHAHMAPTCAGSDTPEAGSAQHRSGWTARRRCFADPSAIRVKTISTRLAQAYPDTNKDIEATVIAYTDPEHARAYTNCPVFDARSGWFRLLIACANIATFSLEGRRRTGDVQYAQRLDRAAGALSAASDRSVMMSFLGGLGLRLPIRCAVV